MIVLFLMEKILNYFNRENKYLRKDKIKRKFYKCIYYRRNQKIKKELTNSTSFCNSTIIYFESGQNKK